MAYPQVASYTSGSITDQNEYIHTIPLPTCNEGDLLVCFISIAVDTLYAVNPIMYWGSSSNFAKTDLCDSSASDTTQWLYNPPPYGIHHGTCYRKSICGGQYDDLSVTLLMTYALGGSSDILKIGTYMAGIVRYLHESTTSYTGVHGVHTDLVGDSYWGPYGISNTKPAYVCYRITGAFNGGVSGIKTYANSSNSGYLPGHYSDFWTNVNDSQSANWQMPGYPKPYDYSSGYDYLYLLTAGSPKNYIASAAPTNYTNLITEYNDSFNGSGISSCRRELNLYKDNPSPFTAPSTWASLFGIRICPDVEEPPEPGEPEGGVGFYIHRKDASVYVSTSAQIMSSPVDMYFDGYGSEDDNPYGTYMMVESTGSWYAEWATGTHFSASQYSGDAGITYVAITCNDENDSGGEWTDTFHVWTGSANDYSYLHQATIL